MAAVHLASHHPLGILNGNPPLRIREEHDKANDGQEQQDDDGNQNHVFDRSRATLVEHLHAALVEQLPQEIERSGQAGDDAREQQDGNTIAYALFIDLLAQPHHQSGARGEAEHNNDGGKPGGSAALGLRCQRAILVAHHEIVGDAQQKAQRHGDIPGDLPQLFPARLAVLGHPLQGRDRHRQQLNDDAGVDVRGDGQGENAGVGKSAARQEGQIIHVTAGAGSDGVFHDFHIHKGHGNIGTDAEDQDDQQRIQDFFAQVGNFPGITQHLKHLRSPLPSRRQPRSWLWQPRRKQPLSQ